jgi:hypothetical protein
MNGDRSIFRRTGATLLLSAAAVSLCACVSVPVVEPYAGAAVDPNSPAAAAIQAQADQPGWPTFEGIPQAPTDVRGNEGWRLAVSATEGDRDELLRATAPSTWSLNDTEGFAARMQSLIDFDPSDVPTAADAAATEAWAAAMRARATPPPRPR